MFLSILILPYLVDSTLFSSIFLLRSLSYYTLPNFWFLILLTKLLILLLLNMYWTRMGTMLENIHFVSTLFYVQKSLFTIFNGPKNKPFIILSLKKLVFSYHLDPDKQSYQVCSTCVNVNDLWLSLHPINEYSLKGREGWVWGGP